MADGTRGRRAGRGLRRLLLFLAVWAAWTALTLRFTPRTLLGIDGYYHIRVAQQYAGHGPLAFGDGRFPFVTASIFHRHFADIEYLFHLVAAPFTLGWHAPPPRLGEVISLEGAHARLDPGSSVVPGSSLAVRPAPGLAAVGRFVVTSVEGRRATGRLVRDDRSAPLDAGFRLTAPGAAGTLTDLGRGRARMGRESGPGRVTVLEGTHAVGTARLGPLGPGPRALTLIHLRGDRLVPTLGAASLEDDRGFVDARYDDARETSAYLRDRGEDPGRLPRALQVPRGLLGPDTLVRRGRLALAFLQVLVLAAVAWVLAEHEVPLPAAGVALMLFTGDLFLSRFFMVRAQLPSMLLLVLGLHFASRRRFWPLVGIGVLYALTYAAPEALLAVAGVAVAVDLGARLLARRDPPPPAGRGSVAGDALRPLAGVALGLGLGLLIHPNAANELRLLGIVNVNIVSGSILAPVARLVRHFVHLPLLVQVPRMSTGWELFPPGRRALVELFPLWVLTPILAGGYAFARARPRRFTVQSFAVALAWTVLLARSERFSEYLGPFWALALALALDDLRRAGLHHRLAALSAGWRRVLVTTGALILAVIGLRVWGSVEALYFYYGDEPPTYRQDALWMRSHLPAGAQVFEAPWSATAILLHYDLRQRFLVALDPRYMIYATPGGMKVGDLARLYVRLLHGATTAPDPRPGHRGESLTLPEALRQVFHARYLLVDRSYYPRLEANAATDPVHFEALRRNADAVIFRLR